ncbi:hypothetical protein Hanom_Chr10g00888061 [Helianthus anomalus]
MKVKIVVMKVKKVICTMKKILLCLVLLLSHEVHCNFQIFPYTVPLQMVHT